MRFDEANLALENALIERARDGRSIEIEAVGVEVAEADFVLVYVWLAGDEQPVELLVDLGCKVSEATINRRAIVSKLFNYQGRLGAGAAPTGSLIWRSGSAAKANLWSLLTS